MPAPSCTPAWLGRPPLMLTPPGTSMTLASRRSAAWKPPPGANCSSSLLPIESLSASVPSRETIAAEPTTSTVCEIAAIGRSTVTAVVVPTTTATVTAAVSKPASDADTRYRPSGSADDAEMAVAFAEHRGHFAIGGIADDDLRAAEANGAALCGHDAVDHAGAGRASLGGRTVVKVWRRTETGEAPRRQGATTENTGSI